ncbi:hypothetical protein EHS25_005168 [Saitozyma podzolica]|uniref:Major facilitator superfamily (MFS) profile domain-containing protein n=1 Tax=Saitozyma podzolica TaxID=1890683 RepID=A0A427XYF1_9TREE|nr:hypothetical protein EHS25_005168 [Saitozyma podzolica]
MSETVDTKVATSPDDSNVPDQRAEALKAVLGGRDTSFYKGHYRRLTAIMFLILLSSMTNGFDGSMMNGLQTLDTWKSYFDNPRGATLALFNAIQTIGAASALPFAGYCSDILGRRTGIFVGCVLMCIGVAVQTAAQNMPMFIAARFFVGFGGTFGMLAAPGLATELAFPTHRAVITALYWTTSYLGGIAAAWTTYGTFRIPSTWSWRIPSVMQALPSVIQLVFIFMIPESPRWLVSKGRDEDALRVIGKYHCNGDTTDPLLHFEFSEIKEAIQFEKDCGQASWKSFFQTKGNRHRLAVVIAMGVFCQWSGSAVISYYLTLVLDGIGITSTKEQTLINGIIQIFQYVCGIAASLVVDRVGRPKMFLSSTSGMCVSFIAWTVCSAVYSKSATNLDATGTPIGANTSAGNAVLGFIFVYLFFYGIAFTPLVIAYPLEILPYGLRMKGMTIFQIALTGSALFNAYVNPIALDAIGWKFYICFCVWLAVEFTFCYFFILETKGNNGPLPLEEIVKLFDGTDAAEDFRNQVQTRIAVDTLVRQDDELASEKANAEHVEAV